MSYVEKHLIPGETLQYQTRLHWVVMLGYSAGAVFLTLTAIALLAGSWSSKPGKGDQSAAMNWLTLVCFIAAAILIGVGVIKRGATEMAVTNKRVIVKTGVVTRRTVELLLPRIESIAVEEPAMGRLLGYGTVIVRGTGGTPEVFEKVAHPLEFRRQVQGQIEGAQGYA